MRVWGRVDLDTIQCFSFLLRINRSRKFPATKKIGTAIAGKRFGGCWRFCRACCSLASMSKTKKNKSPKPKRRKKQKKATAKKTRQQSLAENASAKRIGAPNPT